MDGRARYRAQRFTAKRPRKDLDPAAERPGCSRLEKERRKGREGDGAGTLRRVGEIVAANQRLCRGAVQFRGRTNKSRLFQL